MARRRYGDGCAIAHALDLVGERWALLMVRELLLGPKRFTDLQDGLPGAGPNILAQRLRELENAGVVRRHTLPPPASSRVYQLTDWGAELEPIVRGLGRWGARSPVEAPEGAVGADSLLLTLGTFFDPDAAPGWTATYEVRLGDDRFTVRVVDGRLAEVSRGQLRDRADVTIDTDTDTFASLLSKRKKVTAAVRTRVLTVTGEVRSAQRLFDAVLSP